MDRDSANDTEELELNSADSKAEATVPTENTREPNAMLLEEVRVEGEDAGEGDDLEDAPPVEKRKAEKKPSKRPRKRPVEGVLGKTELLEDFLDEAYSQPFDQEDRERVVDQALVLLEQLYVHLPLKRAMHAVDPVQRLKLLRRRVGTLSELQFNREMLLIFAELRDLHTNYMLPDPFRNRTALLPFLIEDFYDEGERQYMVSHVAKRLRHPRFKPGVIVTHWNGMPIGRAVELNAEKQMGSNPEARHARGLEAMTIRPLVMTIPPDEEWVVVKYIANGQPREANFQWRVLIPTPAPDGVDPNSDTASAYGLGYDALTETARRVKKELFAPTAVETEKRMSALAAGRSTADARQVTRELKKYSTMPDVFSFRSVETPHGKFGYIRLWTFMVNDDEAFVQEFLRIARMLPQNGLILDLRANGGGLIPAGERLLQVLTPRRIEPCRLHFINTPLTQRLCEREIRLRRWRDSIAQAVETGAAYSYGFPIMPADEYNTLGQGYYGPVVLIVDALCYSTTDIFAAGFQDHGIGKILGTSANMGAGGANVWTHKILQSLLPGPGSPIKELPSNASFRVAIRRTTRVGDQSGAPLEGLGVVPDRIHCMTSDDLLNKNEDLIAVAGEMLAEMQVRELRAEVVAGENGTVKIVVNTKNISRLDVLVGGRPQTSLDIDDGKTMLSVSRPKNAKRIELIGFDGDEMVAVKRIAASDE